MFITPSLLAFIKISICDRNICFLHMSALQRKGLNHCIYQ